MTAFSATPINRSPTSPTTIPMPNRPISAAVPDPSPLSDFDVCWSSLTFSRNLALGNAAICSSATGPVDASGDEKDLTAVWLPYVKPIIPGLRTANRNSVIRAADDVRLSVSGGDDTVNEFSVDSNGDTVVWLSKDGDDNRDVKFLIDGNVGQDVRFSVSGRDDQEVGISIGSGDDDRAVVRFSLVGDKDFISISLVGRAEATAGRVLHRCVMLTVTVAAVATVDIISKYDVAQ